MDSSTDASFAWVDAINRQDLAALSDTLGDGFTWELGTSSTSGAAQSVEAWRLWFVAFPDFRFEVVEAIAEGSTVCLRLRLTGTHRGPLQFRGTGSMGAPIAPTDRSFDLPGCAVHHVEGRRISRLYAFWDTATLMRQIAAEPAAP